MIFLYTRIYTYNIERLYFELFIIYFDNEIINVISNN